MRTSVIIQKGTLLDFREYSLSTDCDPVDPAVPFLELSPRNSSGTTAFPLKNCSIIAKAQAFALMRTSVIIPKVAFWDCRGYPLRAGADIYDNLPGLTRLAFCTKTKTPMALFVFVQMPKNCSLVVKTVFVLLAFRKPNAVRFRPPEREC